MNVFGGDRYFVREGPVTLVEGKKHQVSLVTLP